MGLLFSFFLTFPWIFVKFSGIYLHPYIIALLSGLCIGGSAYILSVSTEIAQIDLPRAFAFAILALIAVLPEYAVDFYFAWMAPKKLGYADYALANMTGANRLLIGIGWPLILYLFIIKNKRIGLHLKKELTLELKALLIATLYVFTIPLKNTVSPFDAIVLIGIFVVYIFKASKTRIVPVEEAGIVKKFISSRKSNRLIIVLLLFIYSGFAIFISAEAFAEGLVHSGKLLGIDEFLLVQWLAPLASESPEIIVMSIFVLKGKPSAGFNALVSSKVNQWSLLVGTLPLVYSISSMSLSGLPIAFRQKEEIFLTASQSIMGLIFIADLNFNIFEATGLLLLFLVQFFIPHPSIRIILSIVYLIIAFSLLFSKSKRKGFIQNINPFKRD